MFVVKLNGFIPNKKLVNIVFLRNSYPNAGLEKIQQKFMRGG